MTSKKEVLKSLLFVLKNASKGSSDFHIRQSLFIGIFSQPTTLFNFRNLQFQAEKYDLNRRAEYRPRLNRRHTDQAHSAQK